LTSPKKILATLLCVIMLISTFVGAAATNNEKDVTFEEPIEAASTNDGKKISYEEYLLRHKDVENNSSKIDSVEFLAKADDTVGGTAVKIINADKPYSIKVDVAKVNTMIYKSTTKTQNTKSGRTKGQTASYKKAIVTLKLACALALGIIVVSATVKVLFKTPKN